MGKIPPEATFFKGHPVLKFFTGKKKYGTDEDDFFLLGVKKLRDVDDNIDAVRMFLDKFGDYGVPERKGRYGEGQ